MIHNHTQARPWVPHPTGTRDHALTPRPLADPRDALMALPRSLSLPTRPHWVCTLTEHPGLCHPPNKRPPAPPNLGSCLRLAVTRRLSPCALPAPRPPFPHLVWAAVGARRPQVRSARLRHGLLTTPASAVPPAYQFCPMAEPTLWLTRPRAFPPHWTVAPQSPKAEADMSLHTLPAPPCPTRGPWGLNQATSHECHATMTPSTP